MLRLSVIVLLVSVAGCAKLDGSIRNSAQTEVGRYQLLQLGSMRRDQFLLDTATGKLWSSVCGYKKKGSDGPDCEYSLWEPQDIIDINTTREQANAAIKFMREGK